MLALLCVSLGIACIFDYGRGKIPNLLIGMIFAAGLGRGVYLSGAGGGFWYLFATAAMTAVLYPLFRIGAFGAGDVKLFGVCAGYFPHEKVLSFFFFSMLIACVFSVMKLIKEKSIRERAEYFCGYCKNVCVSGKWQIYLPRKNGKVYRGICLAGPVLCSALLCWGGVW